MVQSYADNTLFYTLEMEPGVTVWYGQIPKLIRTIFSKTSYHNYRPLVNELFQKQDFKPGLFSQKERQTVNGFKAFKKQAEWLCGRLLLKSMIHHLFLSETDLNRISLDTLEEGAPFVTLLPDFCVSLSHSHDYTAAAVSMDRKRTIGLDIEKIRTKPDHAFMKTAFTADEIRHMPDSAEAVFTHWTIKEAYLKYIKRGFNESLHKVEIIDRKILHHGATTNVNFRSGKITDDYVLSLVFD